MKIISSSCSYRRHCRNKNLTTNKHSINNNRYYYPYSSYDNVLIVLVYRYELEELPLVKSVNGVDVRNLRQLKEEVSLAQTIGLYMFCFPHISRFIILV